LSYLHSSWHQVYGILAGSADPEYGKSIESSANIALVNTALGKRMNMKNFIDGTLECFAACTRFVIVLAAVSIAAGCANNDEQETVINSLAESYEKAKQAVDRNNYRRGIQIFEAIQSRYPFSDISRQIQLDLIFAYYKAGRPEESDTSAR
jgi:TolA-binding protein